METEQVKQRAMALWHEGKNEEAATIFSFLYTNIVTLDFHTLKIMGLFYDEQQLSEQAYNCTKYAIDKQVDERSVDIFLSTIEGRMDEAEELRWLMTKHGMMKEFDQLLRIIPRYQHIGLVEESYFLALDTLERIEVVYRERQHYEAHYVTLLFLLIEHEVVEQNLNQARFHLRKLLYAKNSLQAYSQQLVRWSILLDVLDPLMERFDYEEICDLMPTEYLPYLSFFELCKEKRTSLTIKHQLEHQVIEDTHLHAKGVAIGEMILRLVGKSMNARKVEAVYVQYPQDFFIAKMYSLTQTQLPENFWRDFLHDHTDLEEAVRWYWRFQGKSKSHTSLEKCHVTFLGGGEKIGGTSILVSVNGRHVLLDAGMFLNEEMPLTNFYVLAEHGLTLGDLDAVIVSHAHVDHTGSLPFVFKEAPHVPIYMTNETSKLMRILLSDSVKFTKNIDYEQRHVDGVFAMARRQTYNKTFTIPAGETSWYITFYEAGHILGAASVHLQIDDISILFTGDFSVDTQRSCSNFQVPPDLHVDILITESTYGYMPSNGRISRTSQEQALLRALKKVTEEDGTFIIPAFAVGRAQEVLFLLKDAYKDEPFYPFNVVVDGKVIDVCNIYEQHATEPLNLLDDVLIGNEMYGRNGEMAFEEFLSFYVKNRPSCVIASSGMLNDGSSSARYAEQLIESSQNTIAFTGYLSGDSPGYQLLKNRHEPDQLITLNSEQKHVQATIESFRLSAHVSREHLFEVLTTFQPQKIFLMHGEHEKRYQPLHTTTTGEKIYPSIVEMLQWTGLDVTCAYNGVHYLGEKE